MTGKQNRWMLLFILALTALAATITFRNTLPGFGAIPFRTGLDIQGGARVVLRAKTEEFKGKWNPDSNLEAVRKVLENRVNATGVAEPQIITKKPDQIIIELPGLKNEGDVRASLQSTASLQFYLLPQLGDKDGRLPAKWRIAEVKNPKNGVEEETLVFAQNNLPVPIEILNEEVFNQNPIAAGGDLAASSAQPNPTTGEAIINFELKGEGKDRFQEVTRSNIGKHLAIFLDKKLLTAPVINSMIPGKGEITGAFTLESAKALSDQLNAGALPVPLEEVEVRKLEATLGQEAVHTTFTAGIVGLALVLVFMLFWYRLPGLLANFALILYALFSLALFKVWPITLTLPGIAGFILSIGMAVDANILIFERFKEELRSGKNLRSAIDAGFKRAFTAIFDSNVCTIVTCGILYEFGTGPIRGFALTLGLGVVVSMFTAIAVTRTFLFALVNTNLGNNSAAFGTADAAHIKQFHVMRHKWAWLGLSLAIIIPGLLFWGAGGIKQSIDFTGGTEQQIAFASRHSPDEISKAVSGLGSKFKDNRVVISEDPKQLFPHQATVTTERLDEPDRLKLLNTLVQQVGPLDKVNGKPLAVTDVPFSNVSGTISKELTVNAIEAVILASVFIVLYLALRFSIGGLKEGLKYGSCAVIALLHDVLVLWGSFAIMGKLFGWQIDSLFVTAMLTVIGFSVHDTIIVFDRVRENLHHRGLGESFSDLTDRSIDQTIGRSIKTSWTVVMTLLALFLFGGVVIHQFAGALLIGIVSGTYSSIFNASVLLVMAKSKDIAPIIAGPSLGTPNRRAPETLQERARRGALEERDITPVGAIPAPTPATRPQITAPTNGGAMAFTNNESVSEAEDEDDAEETESGEVSGTTRRASRSSDPRPTTTTVRKQPTRRRRM